MRKLAASTKNIRRVKDVRASNPNLLGPKFGLLVYTANVPASSVAGLLKVTEASFYRWIFGECEISSANRTGVLELGKKISTAVKAGQLPVYGGLAVRHKALLDAVRG